MATKNHKRDQKIKYKKAPGAPRRFKSAYMFFSEREHKRIRDESTDKKIRAADVAKLVSQAWKGLPDEERQVWVDKGRLDRERYEREKAAYKGPWRIPDVKHKHPDAPKKPMSAFLAFGNERRAIIAEANPSLTGTEISTLLSKLWKDCPPALKSVYRQREAKERNVFKKKLADWERAKDEELVMEYQNSTTTAGESSDETSGCTTTTEPVKSSQERSMNQVGECFPQHIPTEISMPSLLSTLSHEPELDYLANAVWPLEQLPQHTDAPVARTFTPISRFENYSLEDLLQDDELFFEDFAPSQVVSTTTQESRSGGPTTRMFD